MRRTPSRWCGSPEWLGQGRARRAAGGGGPLWAPGWGRVGVGCGRGRGGGGWGRTWGGGGGGRGGRRTAGGGGPLPGGGRRGGARISGRNRGSPRRPFRPG